MQGNGDFRSDECIELLKEADIIVTNPPFSLFREFIDMLIKYDKKFLIIGHQNAMSYKEIFPLIKDNKMWTGVSCTGGNMFFEIPDSYELSASGKIDKNGKRLAQVSGICWFTNLDIIKRYEEIFLYKRYENNEDKYLKYDNYDAINVDKVSEIPEDYEGVIGVPITFLHKYNPSQFEIVGFRKGVDGKDLKVKGKDMYCRILIRNKKVKKEKW